MIEAELKTLLVGICPRVYAQILPQTPTFDAITYQRISGSRELGHSGPTGVCDARYQIDCYSKTAAGAIELGEAAVALLHGYKGGTIQLATVLSDQDLSEPDFGEFRRSVDVSILY